jgi:CRP-like cAMP-binding protein
VTNKQHLIAYIRQTVQLTDDQLDFVVGCFHPFSYSKHKLIVDVGEVNQYMNFIDSGCVRLFFSNADGQEITRHIVFDRQFATGLASFIQQKPSMESMQTLAPTTLFRISRSDFYYLLNLIPAWETFFRKYLEMAYLTNLAIFQRETTKDATERYKELLAIKPEIVNRLPNKIVASYLNMSPETLSRLKSRI